MEIDRQESGALIVREHKGVPFYEAKWRDATRRQRKRRLGRAWLVPDSNGGWRKRRGRVRDGFLDERRAYREMAGVIAEVEAEQQIAPRKRDARFEDAVGLWMEHLEFEKRAKPSTLDRHRNLLAKPRHDIDEQRGARIMREFEGRKLRSITAEDVRRFLARLDREDISARTVNIHRQILHSIFEHARRKETFCLRYNSVADTAKRPEEGARPVETFEPEEIRAVADAARTGLHRGRGGYPHSKFSDETDREWARINEQDAVLFLVAAFTGLRLGELLALHWSDVDLDRRILSVSRSMSAGEESSTKSRRARSVPLADQAAAEIQALQEQQSFTGRNDYVFCRPDGGPPDRSAVRTRFVRAQKAAGIRVRRFHDLRHSFGSLAIQQFDLVAVKDMMGHSKLTTTERYLHSKPRPDDVAKVDGHLRLAAASCLHALRRPLRQDDPMPEHPPAIKRLDSLLGAVTIAHEIIFETRRELIAAGLGNPEQARLLAESAQIVTVELPRQSATARQLSVRWREQSLLDSMGAEEVLAELESELKRIEPKIDSLLDRQREIAALLRSMHKP